MQATHMKNTWLPLLAMLLLSLSGCLDSGDESEDENTDDGTDYNLIRQIDPASADDVSSILIIPDAVRTSGNLPTTSLDPDAPILTDSEDTLTASPGGSALIESSYSSANGLSQVYFQVENASDFLRVASTTASTSGQLQIPIFFEQDISFTSGTEFCINIRIASPDGLISNTIRRCFVPLNVGTGDFQVSLSWSNTSDIDLHVIEPTGNEVYFGNPLGTTGLQLDVDDMDGFGPENIFTNNPVDGTYIVALENYDQIEATPVAVRINVLGQTRTIQGILPADAVASSFRIATIVVSGNSATIQVNGPLPAAAHAFRAAAIRLE